jgi:glutathione S-transferase
MLTFDILQRFAALQRYSVQVVGPYKVLRYLSRFSPDNATILGYTDAVKSSQIDYWLDFCQDSLSPEAGFKPLATAFSTLDSHLRLRSFLVGYSLSLADIACWGALKGEGDILSPTLFLPVSNITIHFSDSHLQQAT